MIEPLTSEGDARENWRKINELIAVVNALSNLRVVFHRLPVTGQVIDGTAAGANVSASTVPGQGHLLVVPGAEAVLTIDP